MKMKKFFVWVSVFALAVSIFVSCSASVDGTDENSAATGKISGTVQYANVEGNSHGGIMLTLDKTDGLRTVAVSRSLTERSVVSSARTIVASNVSSADGSYTFEGLQAGTYTVYAASSYSSERAVCTNVVVRATETTVADVLKLTATGSITGTVTIDGNASGNTGFLVFVAGTSYMAMTDNAGNYVISGVPAGKGYQVVATKNGVIHNLSSSVTVTANGSATMANNNFTSTELDTNGKDGADGKDGINGTDGKDGIDGTDGKDGIDGISMVWLGEFDSADEIENPKYLNAYFNKTDGCSYIYTGTKWTLLARSGANGTQGEKGDSGTDGKSINWRGSYTSPDYISNPQYLDAYYNMTDGCSYIYTSKGEWALLASKGEQGDAGTDGTNGRSIYWLGSYASSDEIATVEYLNAYYNTSDGCSYIWNGTKWDLLSKAGADGADGVNGTDGQNGTSILWKGELDEAPAEPELNWAYYNTSDGCSYIWNGEKWDLLAKAGVDGVDGQDGANGTNGVNGKDGTGISWLGSFASSDDLENPHYLDAYYNTTDGCSYIWNGTEWTLLARKGDQGIQGEKGDSGTDGMSINWRGSYTSSGYISNPQYLDAYFNTSDGCSYIYDGTEWTLLASKGEQGEQGIQGEKGDSGTDGKSINWLGSYASSDEISNPQYLDAYFNTTDGCSYIYASSGEWQKLSAKGEKGDTGENGDDGVSIVWLGSYADSSEIEEPQLLNAYFNITDGCSYIYNGTEWTLLARKGADGATSSSETGITWRGSFATASEISSPAVLDAYYNTSTGCSYIYNGTLWNLFAKAGADGTDGSDGKNGKDGVGITWLGSYANSNSIYSPKYLDAYWNTTENCAYIYNGSRWTVLAKGPASGGTGSTSTNIGSETGAVISGTVLTGWTNSEGVIRIPNGVTDIAPEALKNKDSITKVIIPSSVQNIGKSAFDNCDNLASVEFLGSGLQIIGQYAFAGCVNLVSISFPNTLTTICAEAFSDCEKLTSMTLPDRLQSIGNRAFYNCKNITTVSIPNSVVSIEQDGYANCSMLRTLTIGRGVTTLNRYTFGNCDALTSVTIPTTVKTINDHVFADCDSLVTVSVSGRWSKDSTTNHVLTIDDLKNTSYYDGEWTRD